MRLDCPFAVFMVHYREDGKVAAVYRPEGGYGLPGGKLGLGETPRAALCREAEEEGWRIEDGAFTLVHADLIQGQLIWWFLHQGTITKVEPRPKDRRRGILPVYLDPLVLSKDKRLGNDRALDSALRAYLPESL